MRTREAETIAFAIASRTARRRAIVRGLDGRDADELAALLGNLTEGMTPGEAMGEALAVGILAGKRMAGQDWMMEAKRGRELFAVPHHGCRSAVD